MLRLIFRIFRKRFLRYLSEENGTKMSVNNLALAFHDLDGNAYYKFPKEMELPLSRAAKIQEFIMWIFKGVSKEEYLKVLDMAEAAITEGIKNPKHGGKVGWAMHELRKRCNMVIHSELFYNIIAAQVIRADESPTEFNNDIQMQKVEAFKAMDQNSDAFFLAIHEFRGQLGLSNITKAQYDLLLSESVLDQAALAKMVQKLQTSV